MKISKKLTALVALAIMARYRDFLGFNVEEFKELTKAAMAYFIGQGAADFMKHRKE